MNKKKKTDSGKFKKIVYEDYETVVDHEELEDYPETKGFLSLLLPYQMLFLWILPIIKKGFKKPLRIKDLTKLDKHYECDHYESRFQKIWNYFKKWKFRLFFTLYTCFFFEFMISQVMMLVYAILNIIYPILLRLFYEELQPRLTDSNIKHFDNLCSILPSELHPPSNYYSMGYRKTDYMIWIYVVVMFFVQSFSSVFFEYSNYNAQRVGRKFKSLLSYLVYKKIFKLSNNSKKRNKRGKILSLVMSDCFYIGKNQSGFAQSWASLFTIFFSFFFLFQLLGSLVFVTFGIFLIILAIILLIMILIVVVRGKYLRLIEIRMNKMREGLQNMLFLKSFNICISFLKRIQKARKNEANSIQLLLLVRGLCGSIANVAPGILTLVTFILYYYQNEGINIIDLLTSLTYFKMLRTPLIGIGFATLSMIFNLVSINRIQDFLLEDEKKEIVIRKFDSKNENSVEIKNLDFFWDSEQEEEKSKEGFYLKNINLCFKKGELIMICGNTNSGKTSLLLSMLGETLVRENCEDNKFILNSKRISYCSQTPFVFNDTILNNIVIGGEYDKDKFNKMLKIVSLDLEISKKPGGCSLEIDEDGRTISGGQKKRIALARACYYNAKIYFFDDIFNGLDYFTGLEVFRKCILEYLKDKTVVLVTNKKQYLKQADKILFLEDGEIVERGKYNKIIQNNGKFSKFIEDQKQNEGIIRKCVLSSSKSDNIQQVSEKEEKIDVDDVNISVDDKEKPLKMDISKKTIVVDCENKLRVTDNEERTLGTIDSKTFSTYVSTFWFKKPNLYGGIFVIFLVICCYLVGMSIYFASEIHVSNLSSLAMYHQKMGNYYNTSYYQNQTIISRNNETLVIYGKATYYDSKGTNGCPFEFSNCTSKQIEILWGNFQNETIVMNGITEYSSLIIYGVIVLISFFGLLIQTSVFYVCFLNTSKKLFSRALTSLFATSLNFFFANPIGRMVSRLCQDIIESDYNIIFSLEFFVTILFFLIGCFGMIIIGTYGIFLPIVLVFMVFLFLFYYFVRKSTIELKRVQSITRSSVIHHFNESLSSVYSIKSYNLVDSFISKHKQKIDRNMCADRLILSILYLIGEYITIGGYVFVFLICIGSILIAYYTNISSLYTILELGIANTAQTASVLGAVFQYLIGIELNFNNFERLEFYINLEPEDNKGERLKIKNGSLKFENFSMKYKPDFPVVLKNVSFVVKPKEKVIILGKSGSGKSSLFLSILKLVKPLSGKIFIDDISIENVSMESIRSELSIIPQEVFVFNDQVRENIDPNSTKSDEELLEIIEKYKLTSFIESLGGLSQIIDVDNLSHGEKRLISLVRAVIKESKIILVDESNIGGNDFEIDFMKVVKKLDRTVIVVDHNLENIINFDKVLIVNDGIVEEFGSVEDLLRCKPNYRNNIQACIEKSVSRSSFLVQNVNE